MGEMALPFCSTDETGAGNSILMDETCFLPSVVVEYFVGRSLAEIGYVVWSHGDLCQCELEETRKL